MQRTSFDATALTPSRTDTTYVAGTGIDWTFQVTKVFVDITRSVDPSGAGSSVQRNQVLGRVTRAFAPLFSGFVAARFLKDSAADGNNGFDGRTYGIGSVGFEWRFLRAWSLTGQYDYTRQKYQLSPEAAKSNAVTLTISYEPHRETATIGSFRANY